MIPGAPPRPPSHGVTLVEAEWLSPGVRSLRFRLDADAAGFRFAPGQWVALELPLEGQRLPRAYSIASHPEDLPLLELAITQVDESPAARYLGALAPGARVELTGPFGTFTPPEPLTAPVIGVATGTGVAPLRPMLRALLRRPAGPPAITLLFGARHEEDLLYRAEFEALAEADPRFVYGPVLSRPPEEWEGARGHVQAPLAQLIAARPDSHVFVCGVRKMVEEVRQLLQERGVPRRQVHFERYD